MEKKNYQKPAVQVINIGTAAIMQGSTESIPMGKPGSGNQPQPCRSTAQGTMYTRYGSWISGKALPQEPKILLIDGVTKKVAAGMGCHLLYMYSGDVSLQIG